ncbi:MAG: SDR family NAD(P)-dependent oxidoreductase [Alphaproteobacteria bacterium]
MSGPLDGRVALVTGASRGIGAAVARRLGALGAHVVLLARTVGGLEETDDAIRRAGGGATLVPVDLAEHARLDALGPTLWQRWQHLDYFVAAGATLGTLGPLGHADSDEWDRVVAVNLTANWRLARTLEPLLRRAPAGRAMFLACAAAAPSDEPFWGAYAVSKGGLLQLARTWQAELRRTPVRVLLHDPGITATALRAQAFPGEDPAALQTPDAAAEALVARLLAEPDTVS